MKKHGKVIKTWEKGVNFITGWKRPKKLGNTVLEEPTIRRGDTHDIFSPKGFK